MEQQTRKEDFGFKGPKDLLKKLGHDIARYKALRNAHEDELTYAACDCAVTGWSMVDWAWSASTEHERAKLAGLLGGVVNSKNEFAELLFNRIPGYQVCYHLATFAKHFGVKNHPLDDLVFVRTFTWQGQSEREPPDCEKSIQFHTGGNMYWAEELFDRIAFEWRQLLKRL
jgi:hypothetical protein